MPPRRPQSKDTPAKLASRMKRRWRIVLIRSKGESGGRSRLPMPRRRRRWLLSSSSCMSFSADGCWWCRSWAEKGDEARQFLAGFFGTYRFCRNFGRESSSWLRFFTGVNPPELRGSLAGRQRRHALGNIGRVLISAQIAASYALTLRLRRGYVFLRLRTVVNPRSGHYDARCGCAVSANRANTIKRLGTRGTCPKKSLTGAKPACGQPPVYRIIIILFVRDAPPTRPPACREQPPRFRTFQVIADLSTCAGGRCRVRFSRSFRFGMSFSALAPSRIFQLPTRARPRP